MFESTLLRSITCYPLSQLVPVSVRNGLDESLIDYIADTLENENVFWTDNPLSLVEPKKFRRYLMNALNEGSFNMIQRNIEDILMTIETLITKNIYVHLD